MKLLRISIGRLMLVVAFIALATVALLRPARLTASLAFSAAFLALTLATLMAVFGGKRSRPFAGGFAVGGWLSLLIHFGTFLTVPSPVHLGPGGFPPVLPTTMLLDLLYPRIIAESDGSGPLQVSFFVLPPPTSTPTPLPVPVPVGGQFTAITPAKLTVAGSLTDAVPPPTPMSLTDSFWREIDRGNMSLIPQRSISFLTIGFSIFTLLFATSCGYLAAWLRRRRESETSSPKP